MAKTKPIGVRFDEDLLNEIGGTAQSVLITLEGFYRASNTKIEQEKLIQAKQLQEMVDNTPTDLREKANVVGKEIMKRFEESIFTGTPILGFLEHNSEIEKQIAAIKAEKIPAERNTTLGKKIWASEQQKRILQLQKQLK